MSVLLSNGTPRKMQVKAREAGTNRKKATHRSVQQGEEVLLDVWD